MWRARGSHICYVFSAALRYYKHTIREGKPDGWRGRLGEYHIPEPKRPQNGEFRSIVWGARVFHGQGFGAMSRAIFVVRFLFRPLSRLHESDEEQKGEQGWASKSEFSRLMKTDKLRQTAVLVYCNLSLNSRKCNIRSSANVP
ncbi:hypothetical protein CI102_13408 [Trichoderma harzianum]|nr:hypothetical protein CI102_13408 [Trichoderma harzianum]